MHRHAVVNMSPVSDLGRGSWGPGGVQRNSAELAYSKHWTRLFSKRSHWLKGQKRPISLSMW